MAVILFLVTDALAQAAGDNFNDNRKNKKKWGKDEVFGNGVLLETKKHLEYRCRRPTDDDDVIRPWREKLPYTSNWEVQLDVSNTTSPSAANQVNSFGIKIRNPRAISRMKCLQELYASDLGGGPMRKGFASDLETDGEDVAIADSGEQDVSNDAAVRMVFDSTNKVLTVYYDLNRGDGYTWVQYGSFGLAGSGGADGNTDWGLEATGRLLLSVYGFSANMTVSAGQMTADNFLVTVGTKQ